MAFTSEQGTSTPAACAFASAWFMATCHACFTGEYPTGDVDESRLAAIETERLVASTPTRPQG